MPDAPGAPGAAAAPSAPSAAPPDYLDAVETVLAEYERHVGWLIELEAEVRAARIRRVQLADAVEGLMRTLGPQGAQAWSARLAALSQKLAEKLPARTGRPDADGRFAALMRLLADWPWEDIEPREATADLRKLGHAVPARYAANRLHDLAKRGTVVPIGKGKYRIVRTSPEMVALGGRPPRPDA